MPTLSSLKIISENITIHIPKEPNFLFLNIKSIEQIKEKLLKTRFFQNGLEVIEEDKEVSFDFSKRLYLESNLQVLCYVGGSFPRYYRNKEIYYGCWFLYEYGEWSENVNRYYKTDGTLEKIERF